MILRPQIGVSIFILHAQDCCPALPMFASFPRGRVDRRRVPESRDPAMPFLLTCSSCRTKMRVPGTAAGKKARCPSCDNLVPVPSAPPGDEEDEPAVARKKPRRADDEEETGFTRA